MHRPVERLIHHRGQRHQSNYLKLLGAAVRLRTSPPAKRKDAHGLYATSLSTQSIDAG